MGLFFTRIDNKEVTHIHNERHESVTTHVKATPQQAHSELKEIKRESRQVLLDQMKVKRTQMPADKFKVAMYREPEWCGTKMLMALKLGDATVKFKEDVPDKLLEHRTVSREDTQFFDAFGDFLVEHLPKYLLGEVEDEKENKS